MINTKKTLARLGAGALATATVAAGLSFGPGAAQAAEKPEYIVGPLVFERSHYYVAAQADEERALMVGERKSDVAHAVAAADRWRIPAKGSQGTVTPVADSNLCLTHGGAGASLLACDGRADQQFALRENYQGLAITLAGDADTFFGWSTSGAFSWFTGVYGTIANYDDFTADFSGATIETSATGRSATIGGNAAPGATVIYSYTGHSGRSIEKETTAGEDGKWSAELTDLNIGTTGTSVSLSQWESGIKTATYDLTVTVPVRDLSAVPGFERGPENLSKPATVSGTAEPGAVVQLREGQDVVGSAEAAPDTGAYTIEVPAPNKPGKRELHASQTVAEEMLGDEKVDLDYGAALTVEWPVEDASHNATGPVSMSGRGEPGSRITVREMSKPKTVIGVADVLVSGAWSLNTDALEGGKRLVLEVTQESKGGNVLKETRVLNPDADQSDPLTVTANPNAANEFTGTATSGATITVKVGGEDLPSTTATDGTWSYTLPVSLGAGKHRVTFGQEVDGTPVDDKTITADFGDAVEVDEPSKPFQEKRPTFTGTGTPGAHVEIKGARATVATATVEPNGTWSAQSTIDLGPMEYLVTAHQSSPIGVQSERQFRFTVAPPAPIAAAVTFDTPAEHSTVIQDKPVFSGTGEPGARIVVRGARAEACRADVDPDGQWSCRSEVALSNMEYRLFAEQTPANGAPTSIAETTFIVDHHESAAVVVETPSADQTVPAGKVTFAGSGEPLSKITIAGTSRKVAETVVGTDGQWTAETDIELAAGDYQVWVTQDAPNGEQSQTELILMVRN